MWYNRLAFYLWRIKYAGTFNVLWNNNQDAE